MAKKLAEFFVVEFKIRNAWEEIFKAFEALIPIAVRFLDSPGVSYRTVPELWDYFEHGEVWQKWRRCGHVSIVKAVRLQKLLTENTPSELVKFRVTRVELSEKRTLV